MNSPCREDKVPYGYTNRRESKMAKLQTDRQTNRQTERETDRQRERQTDAQKSMMAAFKKSLPAPASVSLPLNFFFNCMACPAEEELSS
jgi:hypothetical protein